jgi:ABC-type bacteriocin/lantibiotic exporter with double-glycine peptidase domain
MGNSVYQINKGVGKPVEFKGLKAQYIWYLGGGLVFILILFAVLYITSVHLFFCIAVTFSLGTVLFLYVYRLSRTYGEHGLMKKMASKAMPEAVKTRSIQKLKQALLK